MTPVVRVAIIAAIIAAVAGAVMMKAHNANSSAGATNRADSIRSTAADDSAAKLPKLLDVGAGKCIPCKMMAPVLDELKTEYQGRLRVEFIDIWENEEAAKPYHVEIIPTQIFFDANGKELFRHTGFFGKDEILAQWQALGIDLSHRNTLD